MSDVYDAAVEVREEIKFLSERFSNWAENQDTPSEVRLKIATALLAGYWSGTTELSDPYKAVLCAAEALMRAHNEREIPKDLL